MSNYIMGKNSIIELLKHKREVILEVLTAKDKNDNVVLEIQKKNLPIKFVKKNTLTSIVKSDSHQNIIAKIRSRTYLNLKDFFKIMKKQAYALVLMIDSIFDPQNFGSILRTAECFSVDGLVFSKNRGVGITPVVTKASMGASELVNLIKVSNLASTLDDFTENDFSVVATTLDNQKEDVYSFKFPKKVLLIFGKEDKGIQPLILKKTNHSIHIPMSGKLQSLNVSNAVAIILSYIRFGAK